MIYKQLTLHLSLDLYDNYGYLYQLKEPIEIKYVAYGNNKIPKEDIENLIDSISTTIMSYYQNLIIKKEIHHEIDRPRPGNQTNHN